MLLNLPGEYCVQPDTKQHVAVQVLPHCQFTIKGLMYLECNIIGPNSARSGSSLPTQVDIPMRTGSSARTRLRYTVRDHLALIYNHPTTLRDLDSQNSSINLSFLAATWEQTCQNTRARVQQRAAERALSTLYCPRLPPLPALFVVLFFLYSLSHTCCHFVWVAIDIVSSLPVPRLLHLLFKI